MLLPNKPSFSPGLPLAESLSSVFPFSTASDIVELGLVLALSHSGRQGLPYLCLSRRKTMCETVDYLPPEIIREIFQYQRLKPGTVPPPQPPTPLALSCAELLRPAPSCLSP